MMIIKLNRTFLNKENREMKKLNKEELLKSLSLTQEELTDIKNHIKESSYLQKYFIIVDTETLGISSNAPVISLSAFIFPLDIRDTFLDENASSSFSRAFSIKLNIAEQLELGRKMDLSTVEFWLKNHIKTFIEELSGTQEPIESLQGYLEWIEYWRAMTLSDVKVIYRGMDFDNPMIESLLKDAKLDIPWITPRFVRDARSYIDALLGTSTGRVPYVKKLETHHTSMGDCLDDARQIQIAYAIKNKLI